MSIVIVRHGQSEWNKLNLFTGFKDIGLTDYGREQAMNAGINIKENFKQQFDMVFTSNLSRAIDTCNIILKEINFDGIAINDIALNERDYGDLTGLNKKELAEKYGAETVHKWRRSIDVRPPNGENLLDVIDRVTPYFKSIILPLLNDNKNILIVAHGNSIRALLCVLEVFNINTINMFEIPTGKPMYIDFHKKTHRFYNDYNVKPMMILDSRGNPTVMVDMYHNNTMVGRGTAPSGASTGSNEAREFRDKTESFMGKSVNTSLDNTITLTNKMYMDDDTLTNLSKCDNMMRFLDGTELKEKYGGNTTTALSFMFADVGSKIKKIPLYQYLAESYEYPTYNYNMPIPMVNILNGGKHAGGNLKIQEFMIMPTDSVSFYQRTEYVFTVYNNLKKILKEKYGPSSINLGDEGGFAPNLNTADEALDMLEIAIDRSGLVIGKDIFLALDCAASEFYDSNTGKYEIEVDKWITSDEMVDYYVELIKRHPALKSIEDPFDEKDYSAWKSFTEKCGNDIMIVGDDLFTTNPKIVKEGMEKGWANSLLLKVNQIGTITEAVDAAKMMQSKNCDVIVSHRSGETNNSLISDLAVAIGARYIKLGAPARGERVAKYNRLLEIESNI